ncbi:transporter [Nocardia panacis]|uniref:Transporter n=1 Tax=Nocardia panacis TaxID=2340916 RepID=A0A3A4KJP9_9NOCA|nr:TerD family protein [Nocardia panacis]RJO76884.1 transporter [Nocardia panacis]
MIRLGAGQNIGLSADILVFTARAGVALDLSALVVGPAMRVFGSEGVVFFNQSHTAGVELDGTAITIRLERVRADAQAVLLVVSPDRADELGTLTAALSENGVPLAEFVTTPAFGETALICLELYRRGGGWKVRAVGQGYSGGLGVLFAAHGVEVDEAPSTGPRQSSGSPTSSGTTPVGANRADTFESTGAQADSEVGFGLQRLWMIFEDAARSAAALKSARTYAADRLDQELSAAVADPTTRNTPAAEQMRRAAQRRGDELIAVAESNHLRDSEQLQSELRRAQELLPPALASWDAPSWDAPHRPGDGIRLGELYSLAHGRLRVPYCVPVPLSRPLWVAAESAATVAPVIGALLTRLVAATPDRRTVVDIVDPARACTGFLGLFTATLGGPPVTDRADIGELIDARAKAAEIAELSYRSGFLTAPAEHRILLLVDFPHGFEVSELDALAALLTRAEPFGLSTLIVGADPEDDTDEVVAAVARAAHRLPTVEGTPVFDPWTRNPWLLDLDTLPSEPHRRSRLLRNNH